LYCWNAIALLLPVIFVQSPFPLFEIIFPCLLDVLPQVAVVPMLPQQMQLRVKRTMIAFLVARGRIF
jgi:hypothetical protein